MRVWRSESAPGHMTKMNAVISTSVTREDWERARGEDASYTASYVINKVRDQSKLDRGYTDRRVNEYARLAFRIHAFSVVGVVVAIIGGIFWW